MRRRRRRLEISSPETLYFIRGHCLVYQVIPLGVISIVVCLN